MEFRRFPLESCHTIEGTAVVIDVLRAFTTSAFAFDAGAREIILTDTVESAFRLKEELPDSLLLGEVNGYPIDGFDYSNSPSALKHIDLSDRVLIQRTTAGTQGVVRCSSASEILVASFVCANATADALRNGTTTSVSFVVTGGEEDSACADYIEQLLAGVTPDILHFEQLVRESAHARRFVEPGHIAFPAEDLAACLEMNRFNFAMRVERREGVCILRADNSIHS